ncbi:50S ribosomal protein L10 [bacterium]|nr:50S ribosomal protein L10 [bacterium]
MANITREKKEQIIEELYNLWLNCPGVIFTTFMGIDANSMSELRRRVREMGGRIKVAKHTLIRLTARRLFGEDFELDSLFQNSPTALVFLPPDFPTFLQGFNRLTREFEQVKIKGSIIEGHKFNAEQTIALANLPSREVLLAQVTAAIASPITSLVYTLQTILARLVWALEAIIKAKGGE